VGFCLLQDFYTIVLDEHILEVVARHRDDILAQPPDQDYNRDRRHTAYRQYILWRHGYLGAGNRDMVVLDEYFLSYALFEGPSTVCHEMWVFVC
jgi:hypothetical protein